MHSIQTVTDIKTVKRRHRPKGKAPRATTEKTVEQLHPQWHATSSNLLPLFKLLMNLMLKLMIIKSMIMIKPMEQIIAMTMNLTDLMLIAR